MLRYDATATLPTIGVPVLIVAGDQDTTTLPDASAFMQASIPGAQLTTLAPAKHQGLLEHHAPVRPAGGGVLRRMSAPRRGRDETPGKVTRNNPLTDVCS